MVKDVVLEEGIYDIYDPIDLKGMDVRLIGRPRAILKPTFSPCVLGVWGNENLLCSSCGDIQVKNIQRFQVENISIICPNCSTKNDY